MERGLVASPGSVPTFNAAVVTAEKIRFFKQTVGSKMRFHVTVGHATVMATAEFFGEVPADGAGETATVEDARAAFARGLEGTSPGAPRRTEPRTRVWILVRARV